MIMRKIDTKTHRRFIAALESMIMDMDAFGFTDTADELVISRCELEEVYRKYNRKIEEVNNLISDYYDLFEDKHSGYIQVNRLRQRENTRIQNKILAKETETKITRRDAKRIITA